MTIPTQLPVVVGVDGTEHGDRAVRYAVAEARRRKTGITLVHAVHETAPMAAMLPLYSVEAFVEVGRRLVADAERFALELDPDVDVATSVQAGSKVGVLVHAGEHASAIVLGHRSRSLAGRMLPGSTASGVAARAHCPVISVPEWWSAGDVHGRVVVGVDESEASHDAVDIAFGEAQRRRATLLAVHAWRLPSAYDDIIESRVMHDEWLGSAKQKLEETLAPWRELYTDVKVETELRHEYPGHALVLASEGADVIVVGRRGHGAPLGIHLGSIARLLVREGRCPVTIAPQHAKHEPRAEDRLRRDDEASPQT